MGAWKIALWIGVVALVLGFLYLVRSVLLPFILGGLIAVLLEPLVKRLRHRGLKRGAAVALVFGAFLALITLVAALSIPVISRQVGSITTSIGSITRNLATESYNNNYFRRWNPVVRVQQSSSVPPIDKLLGPMKPTLERFGLPTTQSALVDQYVNPRRNDISNMVKGFFGGFLGALSGFGTSLVLILFAPIVALFLLMDYDRVRTNAPHWIPPSIRAQTLELVGDVGEIFQQYMRGLMISWALYTTIIAIALSIMGAPYGVVLALVFGVLYLIPIIGGMLNYVLLLLITGLSGVAGNAFIHTGSSWSFALILVGVLVAITTVWDQFVAPNLVGSAVGLSPVLSMFVVAAGGALFGIIGMLVAFPIGGAVKLIIERLLRVTTSTGADTVGLPAVPLRHRGS